MTGTAQPCPACRTTEPHNIPMYPTMPRLPMSDGSALGLSVGLCTRIGCFVWWTTNGWYMAQEDKETP